MLDDQLQLDLGYCLAEWSQVYIYKNGSVVLSGILETETDAKTFEFGGFTAEGSDKFVCVDRRNFDSSGLQLEEQVVLNKVDNLNSVEGLQLLVLRSADPRPDMSARLHFSPVT